MTKSYDIATKSNDIGVKSHDFVTNSCDLAIKTIGFLLLTMMLLGVESKAQISFSRQVIGSTGGYNEFGNMSLSSTTGEAVTSSLLGGAIDLTQGFQQPSIEVTDLLIQIYSGITPNGDATNETWIIDLIERYPDNTVSIFNRWGNLVWEGTGYDNTSVVWTGLNKQDNRLPDATYYYIVELEGPTRIHTYKGWVQLSR